MLRVAVLALVASSSAALAVPPRSPDAAERYPRTSYRITARISPDLRRIEGTVRGRVVNDTGERIDALTLWLYPEAFARPLAGIGETNREFYEPFGDGRGGMELGAVRIAGAAAAAVPLGLADAPHGVARRLELPSPLAPLASVDVEVAFAVRVPERLGPLASTGGVLTALGGWHPYLTAGDAATRPVRERTPRPAEFELELDVPAGHVALAGGTETAGGVVQLAPRSFVDLLVRPAALRPLFTRGGRVWPLDPPPREDRGGDADGLPEPPAFPSQWTADEVASLLRALDRFADARKELPDPGPAEVVLIPMLSELALFTEGAVVLSDRAFALPPLPGARRIHARTIARAYLAWRVLPEVRRRERPEDVRIVADALGVELAERFFEERVRDELDPIALVSALDFVPAFDEFLRSPKSPFSHVYFAPVTEPIPVRDEPWTHADPAPRGRLLLEKTRDLLGPPQVAEALRRYLARGRPCPSPAPGPGPAPCGLRASLESVAGRDLGGWVRAWTERAWREDLHVRLLSSGPAGGGFVTRIGLERRGDAPPEVIEVEVRDEDGRLLVLPWRAGEGERSTVLEVPTVAPVETLRVDPRHRVVQAPDQPTEVAAAGDTVPERLQLLVTRVAASYSAVDDTVYGDLDFLLRPRENVRNRLSLGTSYRKARIGARSGLSFGFGELVDAARYAASFGLGLEGDYLREGFAGADTLPGWALGPALGISYDDRPPVPEPRHGTGATASVSGNLGAAFGGPSSFFGTASAGAVQLLPLGGAHVLALRGKAGAVAGAPPVQELLSLGGSDEGLRGFALEETLGTRRVLASVEWRHPLVSQLDVDVGVSRLRAVGGALFAEGAFMAGIHPLGPSTPDQAVFADVGYGLRLRYDLLGVRPLLVGVDFGLPVGRLPGSPARLPFAVSIRGGQSFGAP